MGPRSAGNPPPCSSAPPRPPDLDEVRRKRIQIAREQAVEQAAAWRRELEKTMASFQSELLTELRQFRLELTAQVIESSMPTSSLPIISLPVTQPVSSGLQFGTIDSYKPPPPPPATADPYPYQLQQPPPLSPPRPSVTVHALAESPSPAHMRYTDRSVSIGDFNQNMNQKQQYFSLNDGCVALSPVSVAKLIGIDEKLDMGEGENSAEMVKVNSGNGRKFNEMGPEINSFYSSGSSPIMTTSSFQVQAIGGLSTMVEYEIEDIEVPIGVSLEDGFDQISRDVELQPEYDKVVVAEPGNMELKTDVAGADEVEERGGKELEAAVCEVDDDSQRVYGQIVSGSDEEVNTNECFRSIIGRNGEPAPLGSLSKHPQSNKSVSSPPWSSIQTRGVVPEKEDADKNWTGELTELDSLSTMVGNYFQYALPQCYKYGKDIGGTCSVVNVSNALCTRFKHYMEGSKKSSHYVLQLCFSGFYKKARDKGGGHVLLKDEPFNLSKEVARNMSLLWVSISNLISASWNLDTMASAMNKLHLYVGVVHQGIKLFSVRGLGSLLGDSTRNFYLVLVEIDDSIHHIEMGFVMEADEKNHLPINRWLICCLIFCDCRQKVLTLAGKGKLKEMAAIFNWFLCAISEFGTLATLNAWLDGNFLFLPLENKMEKMNLLLADKWENLDKIVKMLFVDNWERWKYLVIVANKNGTEELHLHVNFLENHLELFVKCLRYVMSTWDALYTMQKLGFKFYCQHLYQLLSSLSKLEGDLEDFDRDRNINWERMTKFSVNPQLFNSIKALEIDCLIALKLVMLLPFKPLQLQCLAAVEDKLKQGDISDMIGGDLELLMLLLFSGVVSYGEAFTSLELLQNECQIDQADVKVIVASAIIQLHLNEATELILSSGMRVCCKNTDFVDDQVIFTRFSYGGLSALVESEYSSCLMGPTIARENGIYGYRPSALVVKLACKRAEINTKLGAYTRTSNYNANNTDQTKFTSWLHVDLRYCSPSAILMVTTFLLSVASVMCVTVLGVMITVHKAHIDKFAKKAKKKQLGIVFGLYEEKLFLTILLQHGIFKVGGEFIDDGNFIAQLINSEHQTCPKSGQKIIHMALLPNYALKSLLHQWCEENKCLVSLSRAFEIAFGGKKVHVSQLEGKKTVHNNVAEVIADIDGKIYDISVIMQLVMVLPTKPLDEVKDISCIVHQSLAGNRIGRFDQFKFKAFVLMITSEVRWLASGCWDSHFPECYFSYAG